MSEEKVGILKEALLPEIAKMTIKHEKAEEYKNKISRNDDCFGIMFDENDATCKECNIVVLYEGAETTMKEICKKLKSIPLAQGVNLETTLTGEQPTEEEMAKKKAEKKAGGKSGGNRREEVLAVLRKGSKTQGEIVEKLGCQNATVNQVLRKLIKEKLVSREKDGKAFSYKLI